MENKEELTQIVKKVQKDKGQFELLYSRIVKKVYFWCYSIIGNEAEAKDVTQEVMIRIYNKMDTLTTPETFGSWMYRLTRNYSLNHLRDCKKKEVHILHEDKYDESIENCVKEKRRENLPEKAYSLKETKRLIASFIDKLPKRQKEVIILYYLEEMSVDEVSKALEYNVGSVKSRLHSGRKNLEKKIKDYEKKHNIRLYGTTVLPLLGMILLEYQEEICSKQDLHFNQNLYEASVHKTKGVGGVPNKLMIFFGSITAVTLTVTMVLYSATNANQSSVNVASGFWNQEQSLLQQGKNASVTVSEEIRNQEELSSLTYTFRVKEGTIYSLHAYLNWDASIFIFDRLESDNLLNHGSPEGGQLSVILNQGDMQDTCTLTVHFKRTSLKDVQNSKITISFEDASTQADVAQVEFGNHEREFEVEEVLLLNKSRIKHVIQIQETMVYKQNACL